MICNKKFFLLLIILFLTGSSFGQTAAKPGSDSLAIKQTITGFLNWYKINRTTVIDSPFIKGGPPDSTSRPSIYWPGVEAFILKLKNSHYVSEAYLDNHRQYFRYIDSGLVGYKLGPDLIKINGMDIDFVLHDHEPEDVLDNIGSGRFERVIIIDNKAIATFRVSEFACLLFTLTKYNKWQIDYLGYDRSNQAIKGN